MKNFVILGLLLVGLLIGGCASTPRGHNFYKVDGYLGSNGFSSTEIIFTNKVPKSVAYIYWGGVPLCVVKGGPKNTLGLVTREMFNFQYNSPPYYGNDGLSLSVEFMDETESRSLNQEPISEIFPVFSRYCGTYNWNFWVEDGRIRSKIQSSGSGWYGGGFGRGGW